MVFYREKSAFNNNTPAALFAQTLSRVIWLTTPVKIPITLTAHKHPLFQSLSVTLQQDWCSETESVL